jgi:hypothetical protein
VSLSKTALIKRSPLRKRASPVVKAFLSTSTRAT